MASDLVLVSHPLCPYAHRAAALMVELGVAFETKHVDLQNKPAWFLEISPRGKVPVLVVEGTPIFESSIILEYLAERFAPELLLADPMARARRRMQMEMANDLLSSHAKVANPNPATQREREAGITAAKDALARFEPLLTPGPFLGGAKPNLVDFGAGTALVRFEKLNRELGLDIYAGFPRAAAWSQAISQRPSFRDTLVADFDERFRNYVKRDVAA